MSSLSFRFLFLFLSFVFIYSQNSLTCKEIENQTKPPKNFDRDKLTSEKALRLLEDIEISCRNCLESHLKKVLSDDLKEASKEIEYDLKHILEIVHQTNTNPFFQERNVKNPHLETLNKIHQIVSKREKVLSLDIETLEGRASSKESLKYLKGIRLIFSWIKASSGMKFS